MGGSGGVNGVDKADHHDDDFITSKLENDLIYRWSSLGRVFVENYAASLAQILHAHEVSVIDDIDHIDWENVPYEDFGLEFIDVQILHETKSDFEYLDIDLMAKAQMRQMKPEPVTTKKVVNGHVPFTIQKWISRHLEPNVFDLKGGKLVLGATGKGWARPVPLATRLACENKLEQRFQKLARMPVTTQCGKADPVKTKLVGLFARDKAKIEHALDRCWVFFTTWCKSCPRYKQRYRYGKPLAGDIALQRECFRNGSRAHRTISGWRRNAELFVMHQSLLGHDPFDIDIWLVASYVKRCKDATNPSAKTTFDALKWIDKCCDTPKWTENEIVKSQTKNDAWISLNNRVKHGKCQLLTWCLPWDNAHEAKLVDQ